MPTPNTTIGDILATSINRYSKTAADNLSKNRPLLDHLKKKGNIKSGGVQLQEQIMYASAGNVTRFSGFQTIDVGLNNSLSAATYDWKQYASSVAISGLEMIQNASEERMMNLVAQRIESSVAGITNLVSDDLFSPGTADGGKQLGGLQLLVADSPSTGTVGGIDRSTNIFWRNMVFDATTDGGAATASTNIMTYLARLYAKLTRNGEEPDFLGLDDFYYSLFEQNVMDKQRYENGNSGDATLAFKSYHFKNARVYNCGGFQGPDASPWDGTVAGGIPYQHGYFLNTKYLKLNTAKGYNFETIGDGKRASINQDAEIQLIGWTGALTMSCAFLQGVFKE